MTANLTAVAQRAQLALAKASDHSMLHLVPNPECQTCQRQEKQYRKTVKYRKKVEAYLRGRLGDRVFESLSDKGYISL